MYFSCLPRDVRFHLLMQEHPKDLFQVSAYIPSLRQVTQEGLFKLAYLGKWQPLLLAGLIKNCQDQASLLGLAALRIKSTVKHWLKHTFIPPENFLRALLDHGDVATFQWVLIKMTKTIHKIEFELLEHPHMTIPLLHLIFDLKLGNLNQYLIEKNKQGFGRPVIDQFIYDHETIYTDFFVWLIEQRKREDINHYLTSFRRVDKMHLLLSAVQAGCPIIVTMCLTKFRYSVREIKEIISVYPSCLAEIRALLVERKI